MEITGVTTVLELAGKRAGYARYALALAGRRDVPVAAGADVSLGHYQLGAGLPPEERYWPAPVPPSPGPLEAALDLLKQSIEQEAIVVAIGSSTNLSLLEQRFPGTLGRAKLFIMGGCVKPSPPGFPPSSYEMDYNVQVDSSAAKHVLESSHPTLTPIEVTFQTALRRAHLPALRQAGPLGQLIALQADAFAQDYKNDEQYGRTYAGLPDDLINFQHDPLACAVALGWDGATLETLPLALEMDGHILRERIDAAGRPTRVVTAVDQEPLSALWLETVTNASAR